MHSMALIIVDAHAHSMTLIIQHTAYGIQHTACTIRSPVDAHAQYNVKLYSMQHTAYSMQHTAYSIQHTAYSIQHTAHSIQHTAYSIQHTPYSIHHAPYTHLSMHMHSIMCSIHGTTITFTSADEHDERIRGEQHQVAFFSAILLLISHRATRIIGELDFTLHVLRTLYISHSSSCATNLPSLSHAHLQLTPATHTCNHTCNTCNLPDLLSILFSI
jgi:hypothetical protein